MHGLYEPEDEEDEPDVIECDRCQELNEPGAAYCMRCGFSLDPDRTADFEEQVDDDMKQDYADTDPESEQ